MTWARCVLGLMAACSHVDTSAPADAPTDAPDENLPTCVVRIEDDFSTERFVYPLLAPGRPASATEYRGDVAATHWTYTYDESGRMIVEELDCCGGDPAGIDGIVDNVTRYEHAASSTIVALDESTERMEVTVDASDHITRQAYFKGSQLTGSVDYTLADDGAVTRQETVGADIDLGPFTSMATYRYEAGRVVERVTSHTLVNGGAPSTTTFVYDAQPDRLVVTTPNASRTQRWIYSYDTAGRPVRSEQDEDGDGISDVMTDIEYDGDAVTMRLSRDGEVKRVYTASSECRYTPALPTAPTSGLRPGTAWKPEVIFVPAPYY